MRHLTQSLSLGIVLLLSALPAVAGPGVNQNLTVAAFLAKKPITGVYAVLAYLAEADPCRPCPPRQFCSPCIGDHIVLSDAASQARSPPPRNLMVFATAAEISKLQMGKRYRFQIEAGPVPRLRTVSDAR